VGPNQAVSVNGADTAAKAGQRVGVALAGLAQQLLGPPSGLIKVGVRGKNRHDISSSARAVRVPGQEIAKRHQ
jgi:hypothetical protein